MLDDAGIDHEWIDLREDGLERSRLVAWLEALGADRLVNRRSTTWRTLDAGQRDAIDRGDSGALDLLQANPTLIKRPVVEDDQVVETGLAAVERCLK